MQEAEAAAVTKRHLQELQKQMEAGQAAKKAAAAQRLLEAPAIKEQLEREKAAIEVQSLPKGLTMISNLVCLSCQHASSVGDLFTALRAEPLLGSRAWPAQLLHHSAS